MESLESKKSVFGTERVKQNKKNKKKNKNHSKPSKFFKSITFLLKF